MGRFSAGDGRMNGVGIDVVAVSRMATSLARTAGFAESVFSAPERAHCEAQRLPARHFALHFAAKEGFLKALGLGLWSGVALPDIEVRRADGGAPRLALGPTARAALDRAGGGEPLLQLSAQGDVAMAMVVLP